MTKTYFITLFWAVFSICCACQSDCSCHDKPNADSDKESDSSQSYDSELMGENQAAASFCNPITYTGGTSVTFNLIIGEIGEQVILSAASGTCSNRVGQACKLIPSGENVPTSLQTQDGTILAESPMQIEPGVSYMFSTNVSALAEVMLEKGILHETMDCSLMECHRQMYNQTTCSENDPCSWTNNNFCDDFCETVMPQGTASFDDSADCQN